MYTLRVEPIPRDLEPIPPAVRTLVDTLAAAGHEAYLVGGCVRDLVQGRTPVDFDLATSASPQAVLAVFATAVPIGLQHGTVMVPTDAGPVDVTSFRAGPRIEDDLGHRDFTLNALAYDPRRRVLFDPYDGLADLLKHRLRAVGSAPDRFAEDPLRALRAARLVSTLGLDLDPEVERAMPAARGALRGVARERVRREVAALLLGPGVAEALALLRRTEIEHDLAPGVLPDADAVVAALPRDLALRLAGWLRGTSAGPICRRLRFPRRVCARVDHLVRRHPVDENVEVSSAAAVRRLIKRAGERDLDALIALRACELRHGRDARSGGAAAARDRLRDLEQAIARLRQTGHLALQRLDLAIDGHEVVELLGCPPGPLVGRALSYLTDRVVEDPSRNTPEALRELLAAWARDLPLP
jgi:tRNA nucleotidyltransferase/poly(A) polymerase